MEGSFEPSCTTAQLSAGEVAASAGAETDYVAESELIASMDQGTIKRREALRLELHQRIEEKKALNRAV